MEDSKCPSCGEKVVIKLMPMDTHDDAGHAPDMEKLKDMPATEMRKHLPVKDEDAE